MHELSLAINIIKIIEKEAATHNGSLVTEVDIVIGELSGVMKVALMKAVKALVKDSYLSSIQFIYTDTKAKAYCTDCGLVLPVADFVTGCNRCHSPHLDITEGKELFVKSITFE